MFHKGRYIIQFYKQNTSMYDLRMWIYDISIWIVWIFTSIYDAFMRLFTYIYCRNIHIYGIVDPVSYDKRTFRYKIT